MKCINDLIYNNALCFHVFIFISNLNFYFSFAINKNFKGLKKSNL